MDPDSRAPKPGNLEGTRWMPHMKNALCILLKSNFKSTVAHFEHIVQGRFGTPTGQGTAKYVLKLLKGYKNIAFMHHMLDMFQILSNLSLSFQRDDITLASALHAHELAMLSLAAIGARPGRELQV